jgi:8-oxo-dGTP pyrophosphatase MutT (NUDIX family)
MSRPTQPRDAASLVLHRRTPKGVEILMGRRPPKSPFIPDAFVFPGGKVDPVDGEISSPFRLDAESERAVMKSAGGQVARARALAFAAIRETFEETGLLIAREGSVDAPAGGTWGEIAGLGLAPDPAPLRFLARAITPAQSPIRFHARFFIADASAAKGELHPTDELLDLDWYGLEEARRLPIIDVTEVVLDHVASWLEPDGCTGSAHPRPTLFVSYREGRPMIREERVDD